MKIRARKAHARVDKVAAGFTIIETILFLAIAAMVFTGVIVGTNGAIRRQRYKDTVQSFTDDLRNLYSLAENTEVLDYSGRVYCGIDDSGAGGTKSENENRGRSDCSVYGVIAKLRMNAKSSTGAADENLEAYWLIGEDEKKISAGTYKYDSLFLKKAKVKPAVKIESAGVSNTTKIEAMTSSLFWGAQLSYACDSLGGLISDTTFYCKDGSADRGYAKYDSSNDLVLYLMIYRSPISGAIKTRALMEKSTDADIFSGSPDLPLVDSSILVGNDIDDDKLGDYKEDSLASNKDLFYTREVGLCITAGDGMSYDGGLRMVKINRDASSANDVVLVEADSSENTCNK